MGHFLLKADMQVARWMAGKMGQTFIPPYSAIGIVDRHGQLVGGVLFNQHAEGDVEVTLYMPGRLKRAALRMICLHAFVTLGCNRISARTRASSLAVREVILKCGLKQEGVLRRYYSDGEDAYLFGMIKEECKWLRGTGT